MCEIPGIRLKFNYNLNLNLNLNLPANAVRFPICPIILSWPTLSYFILIAAVFAQSGVWLQSGRSRVRFPGPDHYSGTTSFVLQVARPSRGSDDHVKWQSRPP